MTDERPDSLAAQAAAWVPPWERAPSAPDRAYPAAAAEPDISDDVDEDGIDEPSAPLAEPDADADLDEAGLSGDDDDFDENFEGPNPSEYGEEEVPPELGALPGEPGGPAIVDAPRELPGEETPEPTDVPGGSELPRPAVVEGASEEHANGGVTVDGPRPGDDTGEVFAIAADDAVGDGDESDLPLAEVVPDAGDETAALDAAALGADETAVLDAVDVPLLGRDGEAGSLAAGGPAVSGEAGAEPAAADADASIVPDELGSIESGSAAGSASAGGSEAVASAAGASAAGGSAVGDSAGAGSAAGAGLAGGSGAGDPAAGGFSVAGASADAVGASGGGAGAGDDAESAAAAAGPARRARRARSSSGIPAQGRGGRSGAAVEEPSSRTEEIDREVPAMDDGELRAALEAILLVVDEPVAEMQLAQIVEQPTERVAGMLEDISARYTAAGHGFDLRRAAGGWRLYTRPEYAPYVERFVLDGQSVRLTQAALETLAVVAYKQPVTRSRISAIRGVNCDGVMRTLVTRGLIEECGTESETGAFLYRTTPLFLEKLGLNSVDQLPPLAPFLPDDVEEVLDASG